MSKKKPRGKSKPVSISPNDLPEIPIVAAEPEPVILKGKMKPRRQSRVARLKGLKRWRALAYGALALLVVALGAVYYFAFMSNFEAPNNKPFMLEIKTGSAYADVEQTLLEKKVLQNRYTFSAVASLFGYKKKVRPGRYKIESGNGNMRVLFLLRNGIQEPVRVNFLSTRTKEKLAEKIAAQVEFSPQDLLNAMANPAIIDSLKAGEADPEQFNPENIIGLFVPNSYELYWNISPEAFLFRMKKEYQRYWNEERRAKAKDAGLTPREVIVMASIVEAETRRNDEKARIAGVYLNRLDVKRFPEMGRILNADPTVVFANGDFNIKRVLKVHTQIDSPYNTYRYAGLPPGPINCPSLSSIEAVLNHERHDYIYFCAREDFSGYHNFAATKRDHNINADKYQRALDEYLKKKR